MKKCLNCGNITLNDTYNFCGNCKCKLESIETIDSNTQFWYASSGERKGPCNLNALLELIKSEKIDREDLLWTNGMQNWETIKNSEFIKEFNSPPPINAKSIDNRFVWAIAFLPVLYLFTDIIFSNVNILTSLIPFLLNSIFWILDKNRLRSAGYNVGRWNLWGFFIMPVYLFIRAYKIDKRYGYAITFIISLFICAILAVSFGYN